MRPKRVYSECIDELQLDISAIKKCSKGNLGTFLAVKAQQEAANVVVTTNGVPSVIFNDLVDSAVAVKALENLRKVVGEKILSFYGSDENVKDESE